MSKSYYVEWRIDIEDATSAEDAARQALAMHRDPESIATVFHVVEADKKYRRDDDGMQVIDLEPLT